MSDVAYEAPKRSWVHEAGARPANAKPAVAVVDDAIFESEAVLQEAMREAAECASEVVDILRDQLQDDSLRHWLYPHGTLAVTTQADHSCGLTLDPSPDASVAFTVHREFGGGGFDVTIFSGQPRATLVCLPHDERSTDESVALRAAALLHRDVEWAEPDDDEDDDEDDDDIRIGPDGRCIDAPREKKPPAAAPPKQPAAQPQPPTQSAAQPQPWRLRRVHAEGARTDAGESATAASGATRSGSESESGDSEDEGEGEGSEVDEEADEAAEAEQMAASAALALKAALGEAQRGAPSAPAAQSTPPSAAHAKPAPDPPAQPADPATPAPPAAPAARTVWASAPELHDLKATREVLGTRDEVLACLVVQQACRERLRNKAGHMDAAAQPPAAPARTRAPGSGGAIAAAAKVRRSGSAREPAAPVPGVEGHESAVGVS
jgi:hypothetical protein